MADPIVADAKAEVSKVKSWLAQHWPHFLTWLMLGWSSLKALLSHA